MLTPTGAFLNPPALKGKPWSEPWGKAASPPQAPPPPRDAAGRWETPTRATNRRLESVVVEGGCVCVCEENGARRGEASALLRRAASAGSPSAGGTAGGAARPGCGGAGAALGAGGGGGEIGRGRSVRGARGKWQARVWGAAEAAAARVRFPARQEESAAPRARRCGRETRPRGGTRTGPGRRRCAVDVGVSAAPVQECSSRAAGTGGASCFSRCSCCCVRVAGRSWGTPRKVRGGTRGPRPGFWPAGAEPNPAAGRGGDTGGWWRWWGVCEGEPSPLGPALRRGRAPWPGCGGRGERGAARRRDGARYDTIRHDTTPPRRGGLPGWAAPPPAGEPGGSSGPLTNSEFYVRSVFNCFVKKPFQAFGRVISQV